MTTGEGAEENKEEEEAAEEELATAERGKN